MEHVCEESMMKNNLLSESAQLANYTNQYMEYTVTFFSINELLTDRHTAY